MQLIAVLSDAQTRAGAGTVAGAVAMRAQGEQTSPHTKAFTFSYRYMNLNFQSLIFCNCNNNKSRDVIENRSNDVTYVYINKIKFERLTVNCN